MFPGGGSGPGRVTPDRVGAVLSVHRSGDRRPAEERVRLLSVDVLTWLDDGSSVPTVTSALEVVDGEVRELIRRRGLDPFTDPGPVRLLVRDVVADYAERSLTSALPPVGDPDAVVRDVLDRVAGFGPLQRWLDDPEVEEIWVNEPGRVFVARRGRSELTTTILAPGELADLVERMLRTSGRRIDMSTPFVDATMPDGSRLHVVIPDMIGGRVADLPGSLELGS